ncbi:DUF397 domain-containing protein [Streptomyces sp. NPDC090046]|uniref:DUF397 domain-containing protein n=1 Tax=Streptomyces sp. NPDC090046 TaxID=3365928 RepID=UPI003817518D
MSVDDFPAAGTELAWHKSSYSSGEGGQCIEVARTPRSVHVRDSKRADGPTLAVTSTRWAAFVAFAAQN